MTRNLLRINRIELNQQEEEKKRKTEEEPYQISTKDYEMALDILQLSCREIEAIDSLLYMKISLHDRHWADFVWKPK